MDEPNNLAALVGFTLGSLFFGTMFLFQVDSIVVKFIGPERLYLRRKNSLRYSIKMWCSGLMKERLSAATKGLKHKLTDVSVNPLQSDDSMAALASEIMDKNKPTPSIIGIVQEPMTYDYYIILDFGYTFDNANYCGVQKLPLVPFCTALSTEFEKQLTSTALCVVADASSNLGVTILHDLFASLREQEVLKVGLVTDAAGWMVPLSILIESNLIKSSNIEKIVFALSRLEAWRLRDDVKASRTVMMFLCGQSVVPALLPYFQKMFPCERHVFVYDGCLKSLATAQKLTHNKKDGKKNNYSKVNYLYPYETTASSIGSSVHKTLRELTDKISNLPLEIAGPLESWLGSVDTFLKMKEDENTNGYLPFVLRAGFLMGRTDGIGDTSKDMSELCLINVLQYITGTRSRPPKMEVVGAAKEALSNIQQASNDNDDGTVSNKEFQTIIKDCVFCHKGILIESKTLVDTVQPSHSWSLKSAKKLTGCACCGPEEEYDDDEDNISVGNVKTVLKTDDDKNNTPGFGLDPKKNGYVDGKMGFAFDPSKFTGIKA